MPTYTPEEVAERRFPTVQPFTYDEGARRCPSRLRAPHSTRAFLKLTEDERRETVFANLLAEVVDEREGRRPRRGKGEPPSSSGNTPSSSREETPAPAGSETDGAAPAPSDPGAKAKDVRPRPSRRLVVACVGGCGRWVPASSARPAIAFCSPSPGKSGEKKKAEPSRREPSLAAVRRTLGSPADETSSASARDVGKKTRKKRARAVCGNSR